MSMKLEMDVQNAPKIKGLVLALHVLTKEVLDWLVDLYTKGKFDKKDYDSKLPDFNGDLHVTRQEPDALSAVNGL